MLVYNKIDIEDINELAKENANKLITDAENLYRSNIEEIASLIKSKKKKIVLISGPSSAGKTTTSYNLRKALNIIGVASHVLNMDDFFKNTDQIPLNDDGNPDIEGLCAIDTDCIKKCLGEVLQTGETMIPQFDFVTHKRRDEWLKCKLVGNEIIIMEGIHALNPEIIKGLDDSKILRIYLDCETSFYYNNEIILRARNLRFLRRIIRDKRDRGVSIEKTISMWKDVCSGEDKNIKPFKSSADVIINTVFKYEPLLYSTLLKKEFLKFKDNFTISSFLQVFDKCETVPYDLIPNDSLLREFIGY